MKYYIIESHYVGPNNIHRHSITIQNEPGRANMSHEIQLDGWLGTSNDYAAYAHGTYATQEAAETYILATWPSALLADDQPLDGTILWTIPQTSDGTLARYNFESDEPFDPVYVAAGAVLLAGSDDGNGFFIAEEAQTHLGAEELEDINEVAAYFDALGWTTETHTGYDTNGQEFCVYLWGRPPA